MNKYFLITKMLIITLMICLNFNISLAQLEFSNWIAGQGTLLHIQPNGKTSLVSYEGVSEVHNQNNSDKNFFILSDSDGEPFVKIGYKIVRYDNGLEVSGNKSRARYIKYMNNEIVHAEDYDFNSLSPFMLKSPNNKYSYIVYKTFSYELTSDTVTCRTQINCFCKNNFDKSDNGKNIVVHEYVSKKGFDYKTNYTDSYAQLPFFCGFSRSDGESVWIVCKSYYEDKICAINLSEDKILKKVYSSIHIDEEEPYYMVNDFYRTGYKVTDNGRLYLLLTKKKCWYYHLTKMSDC